MQTWRVVFKDGRPDEYVHAHELAENTRAGIVDQVFFTLNASRDAWDERVIDGSTVRGVFHL
jgi:hypothetical protein